MNKFFTDTYESLRRKKDIELTFVDFRYQRVVLTVGRKQYVVQTHGTDTMVVYLVKGKKLIKQVETTVVKAMLATLV